MITIILILTITLVWFICALVKEKAEHKETKRALKGALREFDSTYVRFLNLKKKYESNRLCNKE